MRNMTLAVAAALAIALTVQPRTAAAASQDDDAMPVGGRVVLEALAGTAAGVAGLVLGTLVVLPFLDGGDFAVLGAGLIGGIPSSLFAVPAGVYLVGEALGADGNYWWALLGTGVGAAAGLGLLFLIEDVNSGILSAMAITVPTVAGAVIFYEVFQNEDSVGDVAEGLWIGVGPTGVALGGRF